jgi:signal transduction histidine kinase
VTPSSVELSALGFQAALTALLALVYFALWRPTRRPYFATWAAAWAVYATRLGCISAFLVTRDAGWLFAHQAATGVTALLLLLAALQFARGLRWRPAYLAFGALPVAWAYVATLVWHDMRSAGISAAVMLSAVTLGTGVVFFGIRGRHPSTGATVLAVTFSLWGLHHLDYPLLRLLGDGALWGVFADVLFIVAATVGTLLMVLGDGRRAVEDRNLQLETLTHQLLRAQEEERRRIARELHDQAGQVLTAAKIQLDLEGRQEASALVGRALAQVRDLSNLLRPSVLDDLGLVPALRALAEDFAGHTRIGARLEVPEGFGPFPPETQVALYRVVQEALTNVARHAEARTVRVTLGAEDGAVRLVVQDDGRGVTGAPVEHLGLLGIRERVTSLGGTVSAGNAHGGGFRLEASLPAPRGAESPRALDDAARPAVPPEVPRPWGSRA